MPKPASAIELQRLLTVIRQSEKRARISHELAYSKHSEVVFQPHCSPGFPGTDLLQELRRTGVPALAVIALCSL